MAPPQHKIDATLQAMEKAHRATPDEQVQNFSRTINTARRDFEKFANAEEHASRQNESAGGSLLALVENEQALDKGLDRSLEQVKESLAEMERKRMLALGAMTRLSPEEALAELSKVKEHILSLSLRVPIRADFIVHGHNISLSIFRLFEAAERAEAEVDALISAKRSLDHGPSDSAMLASQAPMTANPLESAPVSTVPISSAPTQTNEFNPVTGTYQSVPQASPVSQASPASQARSEPRTDLSDGMSKEITQAPQAQYNELEPELAIEPEPQAFTGAYDLSENYSTTEFDLGPATVEPTSIQAEVPRTRTMTTAGMRLKKALQKSAQSASRPTTAVQEQLNAQPVQDTTTIRQDHSVFKGGNEEYDL
jgi:hypothetical protein